MSPRSARKMKKCPSCKIECASATKTCKCSHTFVVTRTSERILRKSPAVKQATYVFNDEKRARKRLREKPNRYDSQKYEKKKKKRVVKTSNRQVLCEKKEKVATALKKETETTALRAKRRTARKEQEDGGGDLVAKLSPEKQDLAKIILNEINRKIGSVFWKP